MELAFMSGGADADAEKKGKEVIDYLAVHTWRLQQKRFVRFFLLARVGSTKKSTCILAFPISRVVGRHSKPAR